ncbi:MAG: hypothetical protein QOF33_2100 [Thermomicrobiales bacterium]|nr:hypothetical protein [Thermomicrobiales bacterium]
MGCDPADLATHEEFRIGSRPKVAKAETDCER